MAEKNYFEIIFAEHLFQIRDSVKSSHDFSAVQEDILFKMFNRADSNLSYELLERINKSDDIYYTIFNENVSPLTQEKIRLFLLKQYIDQIDKRKLDQLLDYINQRKGLHNEIKFLLFNGKGKDLLNAGYLTSFLNDRLNVLRNEAGGGSFDLQRTNLDGTTHDRATQERYIAQKGTERKLFERLDGKIKLAKAKLSPAGLDPIASGKASIDLKAFKINKDDRKNLEELVILINELNHSEFIAALLQFRIDGLEKRVRQLEKQNQGSFLGFLTDFVLTFVVPFAIGKISEIVVLKLAKNAQKAAFKIDLKDSALRDLFKGTDMDIDLFDDIMEGQKMLIGNTGKFNAKFNSLPDFIKSHIDDYAQFTVDGILKINAYRQKNTPALPKLNSLNEFIAYSIGHNRREIINLQSTIASFADRDLIAESAKSLSLNFDFYYKKMNDKLKEYEAEQRRLLEERKRQEELKRKLGDAKLNSMEPVRDDSGRVKYQK